MTPDREAARALRFPEGLREQHGRFCSVACITGEWRAGHGLFQLPDCICQRRHQIHQMTNIGLYLLAAGLVVAVLVGMRLWIRSRSARYRAQHKPPRTSRQASDQPWEDDKDGGRGNR